MGGLAYHLLATLTPASSFLKDSGRSPFTTMRPGEGYVLMTNSAQTYSVQN